MPNRGPQIGRKRLPRPWSTHPNPQACALLRSQLPPTAETQRNIHPPRAAAHALTQSAGAAGAHEGTRCGAFSDVGALGSGNVRIMTTVLLSSRWGALDCLLGGLGTTTQIRIVASAALLRW